MPTTEEWIENHLKYIEGLKKPSQDQQRFVELATNRNRTASEETIFKTTLAYQQSLEQMKITKAKMSAALDKDKKLARKERDHQMYNCAGLLSSAGLVDKETGLPVWSRNQLFGAFIGLADVPADHPKREEWEKIGADRFAEMESAKKSKTPEPA